MALPTSPARTRDSLTGILVVTCLALGTVVSTVASLNVALPSIARATHASQTELSWVVDAYALVFAALLLVGGALGDRYGRRRALLVGLGLFGAGAIAATLSSEVHWLIAMRCVLGLGAALVMPATLSTITSTFPADQRAKAVGTWAGVAGASAILGVLTSGLVLEVWSWRSVFVVNAVMAIVGLIGTLVAVPESADPDAPGIDWTGAVIAVVGLGLVVFSVIEAPAEGWTSARTVVGLVAGALAMAAFVGWELRTARPLLDVRLFAHAGFSTGTLTVACQFFAFFGFIFLMVQYLQLVLGRSPLEAALSLVPMALGLMPAARVIAPRVEQRLGAPLTSAVGLLVAGAALAWLSGLDAASSYWPILVGVVPLGVGMGLAMTPATSAITNSLSAAQQGIGSAMNDLARELGGAIGIAVLGSVMQSVYRDHVTPEGPGSAFVAGFHAALLVGAGVLAAAAVALLVVRIRTAAVTSPRRPAAL